MRVHLRLIPIHEYNSTGLIRKFGCSNPPRLQTTIIRLLMTTTKSESIVPIELFFLKEFFGGYD